MRGQTREKQGNEKHEDRKKGGERSARTGQVFQMKAQNRHHERTLRKGGEERKQRKLGAVHLG